MDRPSLRQLDLFAQMVAAGSLARCSSMLGVPADAIARDMASLEMRLGYRLFEDLEGAARLTPAGRKTAQAMTLLGDDDPQLPDETPEPAAPTSAPPPLPTAVETAALIILTTPLVPQQPAEPPRQTILLAAPAPVFGHLQEKLSAFEAANEDIAITLDLHVQSAEDAAMALRRGGADIAYFYAMGAPDAFPSRYGWSEQLNLYAGAAHPLARADSVSREDLAISPMIAMDWRNATRAIIEEALERGRARLGPVAMESDDMFAVMAALREGAGLFPAFGALARDLGRMDGIGRVRLDMPLPPIEIRQATSPRAAETPAVEALAEFLFL
ncbi:LysR family transcriptional regulator [Sphingobium lactosutens]|uniref:LysR family transcriptional regulator n=1 Tax=Sphingobium lactosutens TaxID=522773 RepID=UPI0015BF884E|nr:LysR family transcriptional regulator [Sphingobium lactosutens]NWK97186.1 LysR family transcriptional regulator [Sphingobium lactosutens]